MQSSPGWKRRDNSRRICWQTPCSKRQHQLLTHTIEQIQADGTRPAVANSQVVVEAVASSTKQTGLSRWAPAGAGLGAAKALSKLRTQRYSMCIDDTASDTEDAKSVLSDFGDWTRVSHERKHFRPALEAEPGSADDLLQGRSQPKQGEAGAGGRRHGTCRCCCNPAASDHSVVYSRFAHGVWSISLPHMSRSMVG